MSSQRHGQTEVCLLSLQDDDSQVVECAPEDMYAILPTDKFRALGNSFQERYLLKFLSQIRECHLSISILRRGIAKRSMTTVSERYVWKTRNQRHGTREVQGLGEPLHVEIDEATDTEAPEPLNIEVSASGATLNAGGSPGTPSATAAHTGRRKSSRWTTTM